MKLLLQLLVGAALLSVLGVGAAFLQRKGTADAALMKPLAIGMAFFNGIGLSLLVDSWFDMGGAASLGSMVAGTATCLLELGWLAGFGVFAARLLRPTMEGPRLQGLVVSLGAFLLLAAIAWAEFLLTKRSGVMETLSRFVDYAVVLGFIGGGLWGRFRCKSISDKPLQRAGVRLATGLLGFVALLCAWWITSGHIRTQIPGLEASFNAAMFLAFNLLFTLWLLQHADQLSIPQGGIGPFAIRDDLFERHGISKREREIIEWIIQGKTNKEIAVGLYISVHTAKEHVSNIFQKTGAKNRVQLTRMFTVGAEPSPARDLSAL